MKIAHNIVLIAAVFASLTAVSGSAQAASVPSYHDYSSSNCARLTWLIGQNRTGHEYIDDVGNTENQCWGNYQNILADAKHNNPFLTHAIDQALADGQTAHDKFAAQVAHKHQQRNDTGRAQQQQMQQRQAAQQAAFQAHVDDIKAGRSNPERSTTRQRPMAPTTVRA
ncbi:hypothetical protein [Paraburkholderia youngii]|uniref:Uncharacterized protein n=1 Tax=Paraburkholderia youngii TaxID=2782701 RepID=A0ABX2NPH0_9BURK|nr:hypothetical protein [Paraburkholderia youngii]NVI06337.1 hypothetical protein [Paraburkholderia youngii]